MFSTHVVSPPHGTGSRWCGEAAAAAAAATVTTTHFYWLYVRVFNTYMVFFHPIPFSHIVSFVSALPLFSIGYTCARVFVNTRIRRDPKNSTTRKSEIIIIIST